MKIDAQGSMWDLSFGGDAREKSRVSEGYELPRGVRGHAPPRPPPKCFK